MIIRRGKTPATLGAHVRASLICRATQLVMFAVVFYGLLAILPTNVRLLIP